MSEITLVPVNVFIEASPDSIACSGKDITFNSHFHNGGSQPAYQWLLNGNEIQGATAATYTTNTVTDVDKVSVLFKSSVGCALPTTSNAVTMHITPSLTPEVAIEPFISGGNYTFTAVATNAGSNPTYQWRKNGADIANANQHTYTTSYLSPEDLISVRMISSEVCSNPMSVLSKDLLVGRATGITNATNGGSFLKIYPNPGDGNFTIRGTINASKTSVADIQVFNSVGQLILDDKASVTNGELDYNVALKSKIASGNYFVRISINGNNYHAAVTVE